MEESGLRIQVTHLPPGVLIPAGARVRSHVHLITGGEVRGIPRHSVLLLLLRCALAGPSGSYGTVWQTCRPVPFTETQIFSSEPVLSSPKSVLLDQQREQGFGQVNVASCCRLPSVLNKILTFPVKAKFPAQLPGITTNTVLDCNSAYKYLGRR